MTGQTVGQLIGHLTQLLGALFGLAAIGHFFWAGNAPDAAVLTAELFIFSAGLEGLGKALCWFSGETA